MAVSDLLSGGAPASPARLAASALLVAAILGAPAAVALATLPDRAAATDALLAAVQDFAVVLFTLEYALRLWSAPEQRPDATPGGARRRYIASPLGIVDLLAVLPFWLGSILPLGGDWAAVFGLLGLLKLARYAPGLGLVAVVFRNESRALLAALLVLLVVLVLASGAMFALEHSAQPRAFASIPHSLWWGIVTMASVGYGDVTPVTPAGRAVAGVVMLLGIAMFAVPAGILATGFAAELRRRDFIVTWQAVARVPLFAQLDASRIAGIARLLKPQLVPANSVIVRHGERADAMFFIMSGSVEVEVARRPVRLRPGQFFGEIALLNDIERTATVIAIEESRLLVLDVLDFRRLMDDYPDIKANVARVAESRLGQAAVAAAPPDA
ncbi:MAG: cyclic nucleotide-gated ion channel [Dongiaceae bacterium]